MKTKTTYEWDAELNDEHDVLDHDHRDTAAEMLKAAEQLKPHLEPGQRIDLVLVRDVHDDSGDLVERQWAYLTDNRLLPEYFQDSGGYDAARVPARFVRELAEAFAAVVA